MVARYLVLTDRRSRQEIKFPLALQIYSSQLKDKLIFRGNVFSLFPFKASHGSIS